MQWFTLKPIDQKAFEQAETQLHWAAQLVAMAGQAYLLHQEDDSHTSMRWEPGTRRLVSGLVTAGGTTLQVALNVEHFLLQIVEENGVEIFTAPIHQRTMIELTAWLRVQLGYLDLPSSALQPLTHFELPPNPIGEGAPFQKPAPELLRSWIAQRSDAQFLLQAPRIRFKAYDQRVAVWPHHFDSGLVISLARDQDDQMIKGIVMGWAPTDETVREPYLYIKGWMKDREVDYESLPPLTSGHWSSGDWKGGYLPFSRLVAQEEQALQHKMGATFLQETIDHLVKVMT